MDSIPLGIAIVILGGLLSLIGTLIVINLQSIKKYIKSLSERTDKQDDKFISVEAEQKAIRDRIARCRQECDGNNVNREDWVRSEAFTRQKLDKLTETLATIVGKLDVVEKLPAIAGEVARAVVNGMKQMGD